MRDYENPTLCVKMLRTIPSLLPGISPAIASSVAGLFLSRLLRYCVNCLPFFCGELNFPRRHIFVQVRER